MDWILIGLVGLVAAAGWAQWRAERDERARWQALQEDLDAHAQWLARRERERGRLRRDPWGDDDAA